MLIGEPNSTPYDLRFQLGRIPVRVHPFFWVVTLLMGSQSGDGVNLLLWIVACFVSILIHELGHAIAMNVYGESARIVLYGMGGLAISDGGFGRWTGGRGRRRSAWEQIVISAAGPGAGFLLAAIVIVLIKTSGGEVEFARPTLRSPIRWALALENPRMLGFVHDLLFINIFWGCVNLLPVFPLDGGQIARQLFSLRDPVRGARHAIWLSIITAGAIALLGFGVWQSTYVGVLFAYFAVTNYMALRTAW